MTEAIGNISSSGKDLFKMWRVKVPEGPRPIHKHSHMQFEITLIEKGSGIYTINGCEYPIKAGDMFVISSNEHHCITLVEKGELQIVNIHFEPRYLWGSSSDSLSGEHINLCFSHSESFENRIPKSSAANLSYYFNKILEEMSFKRSEYPLMTKALLNQLLIVLIRDYGYADSTFSISRSHLHSIRCAITYIDTHLENPLSLETIAAAAGISPTYFSALFRQISNITLWEYIISKRIEKAIRLISEEKNDETMLEIALQCGFNNTTNFNKAFRKQTGMTPTQFKKTAYAYIS